MIWPWIAILLVGAGFLWLYGRYIDQVEGYRPDQPAKRWCEDCETEHAEGACLSGARLAAMGDLTAGTEKPADTLTREAHSRRDVRQRVQRGELPPADARGETAES